MDKKRKSKIKKYIALGCAAVVILLLAVLPMIAAGRDEADGPQAAILSAQAQQRDIDTQIIGGGQLASDAAVNIKIPENIKLTGYLVGNGDLVSKGDTIANVDKVSVMTAIAEIQETLEYLSDEISAVSDSQSYESVTSLVAGTVKVIYANEGESVQDVMLEHGALAALSLDGIMAVQLEQETGLTAGDKVNVIFKDRSQTTGRVKSNLAGVLTVTMDDDGYTVGEEVTLAAENGKVLGSGELYIYSQWNVTAYKGTVSSIYVDVGDTVYVGRTLMLLSEPGQDAQYQRLIDQRREYEEMMQELFVMYRTGTLSAPCDGIVTGVDEDADYVLEDDKGLLASLMSYFAGSKNEDADQSESKVLTASSLSAVQSKPKIVLLGAESTGDDSNGSESTGGESSGGESTGDDSNGSESTGGEATGGESAGDTEDQPSASVSYLGYLAKITEIADGSMTVMQTPYSYKIDDLSNLPTVSIDASAMTVKATYVDSAITASSHKVDDIVFIITDSSDKLVKIAIPTVAEGGGNSGQGNAAGGNTASGGGAGGMSGTGGSTAVQTFELYSLDKVTIASVTSQEQMSIEFTVDELDIGKIYTGQPVTIAVEAIAGEYFDATITQISNSGENSGGNSKFTVEATVEKNSSMLPGMTAYAFIKLDTAVNALTVPSAALYLENGQTLVYTGYNEKTESLTNPIAVSIGVADADYVQITEGMTAGQQVFYEYFENKDF